MPIACKYVPFSSTTRSSEPPLYHCTGPLLRCTKVPRQLGASSAGGLVSWGPRQLGASSAGGLVSWGPRQLGASSAGGLVSNAKYIAQGERTFQVFQQPRLMSQDFLTPCPYGLLHWSTQFPYVTKNAAQYPTPPTVLQPLHACLRCE